MRPHTIVLLTCLVGCGCPQVTSKTIPPPPTDSASPIGRTRTGVFVCPHGDVLHFGVSYPWPNEDGSTVIESPPRAARSQPGIHLCGAWEGVDHGEALACRDPEGRFDGPVEILAPDQSVVLQGYCSKGAPIGPWVTWRAGRAVDIVAQDG